jgi:hypothetical protein
MEEYLPAEMFGVGNNWLTLLWLTLRFQQGMKTATRYVMSLYVRKCLHNLPSVKQYKFKDFKISEMKNTSNQLYVTQYST